MQKRTRPFTSSNDKPPALKKQTTSHAQKTTSAKSGDSSHTVELAISDEEGAADTWVGDGDLISENTTTSFPKSDEVLQNTIFFLHVSNVQPFLTLTGIHGWKT